MALTTRRALALPPQHAVRVERTDNPNGPRWQSNRLGNHTQELPANECRPRIKKEEEDNHILILWARCLRSCLCVELHPVLREVAPRGETSLGWRAPLAHCVAQRPRRRACDRLCVGVLSAIGRIATANRATQGPPSSGCTPFGKIANHASLRSCGTRPPYAR